MKYMLPVILLQLLIIRSYAQPTGNSGIYFAITDQSAEDSIRVTDKLSDTQFDRKAAFRINGYRILDLGEKQYGFHKRKYHRYPCKEYFWFEDNVFSIISPDEDTMTIRFVNLPVAYYFIQIPFQPGSYTLLFPKDSSTILLEKYFPIKKEEEMYYGYDISPRNWSKYLVSPDQPADRVKTSIIPIQ